MSFRSTAERCLSRVSLPWLTLAIICIAVIWGNSLVPGEGSGGLSLSIVNHLRGVLDALGLPYAWVTNYLVRKAAHFTEYLVLGFIVAHAFDPQYELLRASICAAALLCVLVPSVDEIIQLFVPGRSGQISDVLLDCCGAAAGIAVRSFAACRICRRREDF